MGRMHPVVERRKEAAAMAAALYGKNSSTSQFWMLRKLRQEVSLSNPFFDASRGTEPVKREHEPVREDRRANDGSHPMDLRFSRPAPN